MLSVFLNPTYVNYVNDNLQHHGSSKPKIKDLVLIVY